MRYDAAHAAPAAYQWRGWSISGTAANYASARLSWRGSEHAGKKGAPAMFDVVMMIIFLIFVMMKIRP